MLVVLGELWNVGPAYLISCGASGAFPKTLSGPLLAWLARYSLALLRSIATLAGTGEDRGISIVGDGFLMGVWTWGARCTLNPASCGRGPP